MNEQKKDTALDEEALEGVTGGKFDDFGKDRMQGLMDQTWDKVLEGESSKNDKEVTP